jgi:hypothetical protein
LEKEPATEKVADPPAQMDVGPEIVTEGAGTAVKLMLLLVVQP